MPFVADGQSRMPVEHLAQQAGPTARRARDETGRLHRARTPPGWLDSRPGFPVRPMFVFGDLGRLLKVVPRGGKPPDGPPRGNQRGETLATKDGRSGRRRGASRAYPKVSRCSPRTHSICATCCRVSSRRHKPTRLVVRRVRNRSHSPECSMEHYSGVSTDGKYSSPINLQILASPRSGWATNVS
jgi:hypothetical protein